MRGWAWMLALEDCPRRGQRPSLWNASYAVEPSLIIQNIRQADQ
jgi:hypothetical protein